MDAPAKGEQGHNQRVHLAQEPQCLASLPHRGRARVTPGRLGWLHQKILIFHLVIMGFQSTYVERRTEYLVRNDEQTVTTLMPQIRNSRRSRC